MGNLYDDDYVVGEWEAGEKQAEVQLAAVLWREWKQEGKPFIFSVVN